jgi:glycosyltransferase involved in cell wall biosynthesis
MPAIHQLVAGFNRGDAISNEAMAMRQVFRGWGYASDIWCETRRILPELRGDARELEGLADCCAPEDLVLLHLSIGSAVNTLFPALPGRKALLYHNITPADYFALIQPATANLLARGREQAKALAGVAAVNLADSRYNADELQALGYGPVAVLPLILNFETLKQAPDRRTLAKFDDGRRNVVFVGRCAPNKKLEDVISAFACYQKAVEPDSRLILAGSYAGTERYQRLLVGMARELRLTEVVFTGAIPQAELNACYRSAHVFLGMSEHEGFCIPLVEALFHKVPVLAYAAAAVPETLDGAGVLFQEKNYPSIAEMLGRLVEPGDFRQAVLDRQAARLRRFMGRDLAAELRQHLLPLMS